MFLNMADVNRVWVSVERGSYGANKLVKFFAGGDSVADVHAHLSGAFGDMAADNILAHVGELGTEEAFDNLKQGGVVGGTSGPATSKPAADGPICQHGPRVLKSGVKNGNKWSAWMCPTAQGAPDKCKPEWV
jgi:hypothetical protein